jgi:hypothetical protein
MRLALLVLVIVIVLSGFLGGWKWGGSTPLKAPTPELAAAFSQS